MTTLPPLTTKQQTILKLIYRYRFLDRTQIQALFGHKDKRRVISWLKDLRDKGYVDWRYDATNFIAKAKPAIYYLALNGIRYLREVGGYPDEELRKRYKDSDRTQIFIDRCLLVADCCIALRAKSNGTLQYSCALPADYVDPGSPYHFLNELRPHLFFAKQDGGEVTNYLLESFELTLPRYQLRKRLKDYVDFLARDWDDENGTTPTALFVCATTADLIYIKRRVKKLVGENWPGGNLQLSVTTLDKIKESGVTGIIWGEVSLD